MIRGLRGALAIAAMLGSGTAGAQVAPSDFRAPEQNGDGMDTHLFRPAVDSKGFFTVNGTDILGANDVSFGLVLDYGNKLMRTSEGGVPNGSNASVDPPLASGACAQPTDLTGFGGTQVLDCQPSESGTGDRALVDHSITGTWNFNYGIASRAVVGISVPVVLMSGNPAFQIGDTGTGLYNADELNQQSISTIALHGKLRLTRVDRGVGLAVLVQGGVPIGDTPRNLGADPGAWYWPQLLVEKDFGATRRFKLAANVGYRGHTGADPTFNNDTQGQPQLAEGVMTAGARATAQAGFAWRVFDAMDLIGEAYTTYLLADADSAQKLSPEAVGGIKLFIEKNSYLMLGGGRRIGTGFEAANLRAFLGFTYEPSIGDRDGDGLKDDEDQCPDDPEDMDGFKDEDGCPDPDNDNDGILDIDDRCPNIPEDHDGDEDDDGCPETVDGDRDGDGILDSKDKCPDDPEDRDGFKDSDGCPDPDNDQDGILDKDDQCPLDPEDKDGFEDEDGCPDPDNDKDQILDVDDKCPNEPETYNGKDDEDGCPDKGKVIIEGSDILILDKVQFATGSAEILPESFPILDAVSTTLNHHPEFLVVEVAGHADERSSDTYNQKLTTDRARSVVEAVVQRGVNRKRLVSQGYGEYCPLDEGHNNAAWEKNRRVEFKVVKTEDGDTGVERGCDIARNNGVFPPKLQ